jgi:hypothetical protein
MTPQAAQPQQSSDIERPLINEAAQISVGAVDFAPANLDGFAERKRTFGLATSAVR